MKNLTKMFLISAAVAAVAIVLGCPSSTPSCSRLSEMCDTGGMGCCSGLQCSGSTGRCSSCAIYNESCANPAIKCCVSLPYICDPNTKTCSKDPCSKSQEACTKSEECCAGLVCNNISAKCQACSAAGADCLYGCCSGLICGSSTGKCETCSELNNTCDEKVPCCTGLECRSGLCVNCNQAGEICEDNCCMGLICNKGGYCEWQCTPTGELCANSADMKCCSGLCCDASSGRCNLYCTDGGLP